MDGILPKKTLLIRYKYDIQKLDDKNIYRNQKALNQTIVYPYWEVPKFF